MITSPGGFEGLPLFDPGETSTAEFTLHPVAPVAETPAARPDLVPLPALNESSSLAALLPELKTAFPDAEIIVE